MNEYEEQVLECHKAMEVAIDEPYSVDLLRLRQKLLREEMNELDIEINSLIAELEQSGITQKETRARMMKELADLQYVLSGMVVAQPRNCRYNYVTRMIERIAEYPV